MVLPILKKYTFICAMLCCLGTAWPQNLVKNSSFESFSDCPKDLGNLSSDVDFWSTPTLGSTDYFNGCSVAMGTPENFNGKQPADFGKGYAGLYLYAPEDYREYLQAELKRTLVKGRTYQVSFYVSLAERSDFAVKEFGLLFSNNKINIETRKTLSKKQWYRIKGNTYTYMEIGYTNFYSDTKDWLLLHTQFEAKGDEKYLIIGNFKNNKRTRLFRTKRKAKQGAYYYLDEVVVKDMTLTANTFDLDRTHIFKNLLFAFDKSDLADHSIAEIDKVYSYLKSNPKLQITINGHTDKMGGSQYNMTLSADRAKAVANYLISLGLSKDRVKWEGHGGSLPIADNTSKYGRKQNRRVEFLITVAPDSARK